mgnify:FL=1|jgi:hypothetical protein
MTDKVAGGCLCGNVRFETAATPAAQVLCFCTDCQHISGSMCYTAYIVQTPHLLCAPQHWRGPRSLPATTK